MEVNPKLISFTASSKRRIEILSKFKDKQLSQPEIKKETKMYKSHISRTLKELSENKLLKCLNPDDRTFKFYKITSLGMKVLNEVQRIKKLI